MFWTPLKAGVAVVLLIVALMAVVFGIKWATADVRGAGDARERVHADGGYRIAAYDKFYDDCAAIQALEDKLTTARDRPADETYSDAIKGANVAALANQRAELVRAYNADARKADTKANFIASDLPAQIDPTQENTTCSAPTPAP